MDTVKSRLSGHSMARLGLNSEVEHLQQKMQSVVTFALQAVQEDPQCLESAARDFALSLANIYVGKLSVFLITLHQ